MQSLWMLFAAFVFSIMGVCVKLASEIYSTSEIVMYRGLVGVAFILILIRLRGGTLKTTLARAHLLRSAVGVTSLWLWFYAIAVLPLATAMTLNYMAPIWIAAIMFAAGWWKGLKRFEWGVFAAILASFAGVTMLLRPAISADQLTGGVVAVISSIFSALAFLQVKRLGELGEPEYRVVFYFSMTGVISGLLGSIAMPLFSVGESLLWHRHTTEGVALLFGLGLTATVAQMAMTRAYRLGKMLVTANLQYSGIVFSSAWGILIWGDRLSLSGWLGIATILASGMAATFYNARNTQRNQARAAQRGTDPIVTEL